MTVYEFDEAAARGGVSPGELRHFVELGVVAPGADGRFTAGGVRCIGIVQSVVAAGIALEGLAAAVRSGQVSLDFIEAPAFDRFSALSEITFAQLAEQTGVPVELLMQIREAAGSPAPRPEDLVRDEELPSARALELGLKARIRPGPMLQLMRVQGDAMRRVAETESALWQTDVIGPAMAAGMRPDEILGSELGDQMSAQVERAVLGMYHLQQAQAWGGNIIEGLETQMAAAGLHSRLEHPPAMCFFDITGYTRLTQERGDAAAAELAEELAHLVQQTSIGHGGRPVKWLGDGVMIHFPNPGPGVLAALGMVEGVVAAGLPPAHVGLHAGPVIFQQGDYYGQTVNLASRIADVASAGQVLVSQAVIDACRDAPVLFREAGAFELKGVTEPVPLFSAARA